MCLEMERCKESEIVAERFKASSKKINQNLADAIVSVQTGCRTYRGAQPASGIGRHFFFPPRRNTTTRTITVKTNGKTELEMGPVRVGRKHFK